MIKRHKEWYSRGYLPHFDHTDVVQMITFRLADALPHDKLDQLKGMIGKQKEKDAERRKEIEVYLDAGYGTCPLRESRIGSMVEDSLLHFDGQGYRLIEMGRHAKPCALACRSLLRMAATGSAKVMEVIYLSRANRILGRSGQFWQEDYFDRFIRDMKHFESAKQYIRENPVTAGLVKLPEDWPYSSASWTNREMVARA